jgi:nitroimidazol reductase NimA-like FMN-containing flavoprotein (pyridoxamine 5'-phosphate oxidase superfamily)
MSLEELETLLATSKEAASPFTRTLEGEDRTAQDVEEFINHTQAVTLAVVRKNGLPHAVPVIGGSIDGEILVTVSPGSVLANCLRRSPEVAFTIADLVHSVIGAGTAENLGRLTELEETRGRLERASPFGQFAPAGWDGFIFRLRPRRLFAF